MKKERMTLNRLSKVLQGIEAHILAYPVDFFTDKDFSGPGDYLTYFNVDVEQKTRTPQSDDDVIYVIDIGPAFVFELFANGDLCYEGTGEPIFTV